MSVGAISYYCGFATSGILSILLYTSWRGNNTGRWLIFATLATAIWCLVLGLQAHLQIFPSSVIWTAELLHSFSWIICLLKLLNPLAQNHSGKPYSLWRILKLALWLTGILQLSYIWLEPWLVYRYPGAIKISYSFMGNLYLALLGLVLVEQYFRNTRTDHRWRIKFICFALGAIFAYDFYLYSDALLFKGIKAEIWAARGAIIALVTPLVAVSASRNPDWRVDIFVSRQVVFHSVTLFGAGIYMLLMATAGYYIRVYGGEWGKVAQIIFLFGAFLLLMTLLLSGQMRAKTRNFFTRNFFNYAYDYRREWLRIINTLSETHSDQALEERIIMVLGKAVESPGGVLWVRESNNYFIKRASFGEPDTPIQLIHSNDPLIQYMTEKEQIINLDEMVTMPEAYEGLTLPEWLGACPHAWLLVPLPHKDQPLYGVLLLNTHKTRAHWNWEAIDLLRTSSRLAASYLALEDAGRALAEARQFEGFNRLSAFVMHDLKNLIAQLSLVVRNAEKHHNNPEFMRDAIRTVEHSVDKMSRLMAQIKNFATGDTTAELDLTSLLKEVINSRSFQLPIPLLEKNENRIFTQADPDRLGSALEHIIHNAQDAAGKHGTVTIRFELAETGHAVIKVIDNGHGMEQEFIRTRLFKPFDTTKGLTGMGIGAYESREYIRSIGGELFVKSEIDRGTQFTFLIPVAGHLPNLNSAEVTLP